MKMKGIGGLAAALGVLAIDPAFGVEAPPRQRRRRHQDEKKRRLRRAQKRARKITRAKR